MPVSIFPAATKECPGNLIGLARVDIPSVFVPGGTMNAGPEMLTLEQLGMYSAKFERGEIDEEKLDWAKCNACPSCGACSFIGTASTMQIMAEALGLALPGTALMPATSPDLLAFAREAGRQAVRLAKMEHMRPSDIVTMESLKMQFSYMRQFQEAPTACFIFRQLHMNLVLRLPEIPLTDCTEMPDIFLDVTSCRTLAGRVLLLCRRCTGYHGRNQGTPPSGCNDCLQERH